VIARRDPPEGPARGEPLDLGRHAGDRPRHLASRPASRRGMLVVIGLLLFGVAFAAAGFLIVRNIVRQRQEAKDKAAGEGTNPR
jgi:hypothetical protein